MNGLLVIDASIALKWVVAEVDSDAATALLENHVGGAVSMAAPEHLLGEVGNGLRKRVVQGNLTPEQATGALDALGDLELGFHGGPERWLRSLRAALEWNVTSYDALYLLLALDLDAELITADQRLIDSAEQHSLPARGLVD